MTYKLCSKLWLEKGGKVFGDGPCDLLQRVERLGSLRQAAREMKMSYAQAWHLILGLEEKLGFPLLEKRAGGKAGGGSNLTEEGRELMNRFAAFRRQADQQLARLFKDYFSGK